MGKNNKCDDCKVDIRGGRHHNFCEKCWEKHRERKAMEILRKKTKC